MKIKFKNVALLAVLSMAAVSCQKEDVLPNIGTEQTSESILVMYSINGEVFQTTISESEWDAFVFQEPYFPNLAEQGEGYFRHL